MQLRDSDGNEPPSFQDQATNLLIDLEPWLVSTPFLDVVECKA